MNKELLDDVRRGLLRSIVSGKPRIVTELYGNLLIATIHREAKK